MFATSTKCCQNEVEILPKKEGSFDSLHEKQMPGNSESIEPLLRKVKDVRRNTVNIQMISEKLHKQIFRVNPDQVLKTDKGVLQDIRKHFGGQKMLKEIDNVSQIIPFEVNFQLPKLEGRNVEEHFQTIASKYTGEYKQCADILATNELPAFPTTWQYKAGWTKYLPDGSSHQVAFPDDQALVFDVEVLMKEGEYPTMATAASPSAW